MKQLKIPQSGGGSIITDLTPLTPILLPENIIYQNERRYLGNLSFSLSELNQPSIGGKKVLPVEYGYASTKELPNSTFIIVSRYPLLPYWNRYYSHPYIEELSKYTYSKPGAHHVFRWYNNAIAHIMVENTAYEENGYKLAHPTLAFTY